MLGSGDKDKKNKKDKSTEETHSEQETIFSAGSDSVTLDTETKIEVTKETSSDLSGPSDSGESSEQEELEELFATNAAPAKPRLAGIKMAANPSPKDPIPDDPNKPANKRMGGLKFLASGLKKGIDEVQKTIFSTRPNINDSIEVGDEPHLPDDDIAEKVLDTASPTLVAKTRGAGVDQPLKPTDSDFGVEPASFEPMETDKKRLWDQTYGENDFFALLGQTIQLRANQVKDTGLIEGLVKDDIHDQHYKRTQSIEAAVRFAEFGARQELADLLSSNDNSALATQQIEEARAKVMVAERVREMFGSLAALSRMRSRWMEENYNQRIAELNKLMADYHLNEQQKTFINIAIQNAQAEYNYKKEQEEFSLSKGSTPFSSLGDSFSLSGKFGGQKVDHYKDENGNKVVHTTFTFGRRNLAGKFSLFLAPAAAKMQEKAYNQMKVEINRFMSVAIYEHGKGTRDLPICVRYVEDNNGNKIRQPDLGLAIMLDLKQRAITDGREFTMTVPADLKSEMGVDTIQITAGKSLTEQEKRIMRHYARGEVDLNMSQDNKGGYGGNGILRHAGQAAITDERVYEVAGPETDMIIDDALQSYVDKQVMHLNNKHNQDFEAEISKLRVESGLESRPSEKSKSSKFN